MQSSVATLFEHALDWRPLLPDADAVARWTDHDDAETAGRLAGRLILTLEDAIRLKDRLKGQSFEIGVECELNPDGDSVSQVAVAVGRLRDAGIEPDLLELLLPNEWDSPEALRPLPRLQAEASSGSAEVCVCLEASHATRPVVDAVLNGMTDAILRLDFASHDEEDANRAAYALAQSVDLEWGFRLSGRLSAVTNHEAFGIVNLVAGLMLRLTEDLSQRELVHVILEQDEAAFEFVDGLDYRDFRCDEDSLLGFRTFFEGVASSEAPHLARDVSQLFP